MKKMDLILKEILSEVNPSKEDLNELKEFTNDCVKKLIQEIKKRKINAEVFVGGSYAKGTMIKKNIYDIDVFVRFDKSYGDNEIADLLEEILKIFKDVKRVHGSRDYFQMKIKDNLVVEFIPVIKVSNPEKARNITDLSYSHVKWIKKNIDKKIIEEIKIAKAFCYGCKCYGAESYVKGFSGYSIELLVFYYKGFLNFIKAVSKLKDNKLFIDIEKHYKNKQEIQREINKAKMQSPIVLIDPTFKQRNALAGLSEKTLKKFKENCSGFLKNPSIEFFYPKRIDFKEEEKIAKKNKKDFMVMEIKTERQEGTIAGSKLLKFYENLVREFERFFVIDKKVFEYNGKQMARFFLVGNKKKEIVFSGPFIKDEKSCREFKKKHKEIYKKDGRFYAREKNNLYFKDFIEKWEKKYSEKISKMHIKELRVILD